MDKRILISEIPADKTFEDYSDDTIFVLDEDDEENWNDISNDKK